MAPKYRFDADGRMDAPTSAFFSRQLEIIRPQVYEYTYDELLGRQLVPINHSIDPGAEIYTYRWYEQVGAAKFVTDYGTDFPRVDLAGHEASVKLHSIGDSYGWSVQEGRASQLAGVGLDTKRAKGARDAIELLIDDVLTVGSAERGLRGLFSQPIAGSDAVTVASLLPGEDGNTWASDGSAKTPQEIVDDLHAAALKVNTDTRGKEAVDSLVLPPSSYGYLATKSIDGEGGATILDTFVANDPFITSRDRISKHYGLETAGDGNTRRAVFYKKDATKLEGLISQEFEQFPPEHKAMQIITTCHARIGGVIAYFPKSIAYLDGF